MDRNGMAKGELYKPDSLSFGGGRGNGRDFDFEQFRVKDDEEEAGASTEADDSPAPDAAGQAGDSDSSFGGSSGMPQGGQSDFSASSGDSAQNAPQGQTQQGDFSASSGDSAQNAPQGQTPQGDFSASSGDSAQNAPQGQTQQGDFAASSGDSAQSMPQMPDGFTMPDGADGAERPEAGERPDAGDFGGFGGFNFGMGSEDVKLIYSDDDPDSYSNIFNNAKTTIQDKDKTRLIESLRKLNAKEDIESVVNTDEVISYLAVHNFLCNDDSYTGMMVHNYYLYEEKGELTIIPWDYNLAFGGFSAGTNATSTVNSPIDSPVSSGTTDSRPLIAWIFSDEDSLAAYHETYDRFIAEYVESGWLAEEIERVKEMISPYLEKDESAFYDMDAFEKATDTLQTFCQKRGESIRGQLDGTIPSTTQAQRTNSAALVDASDISTADMGSMNGGGGFGG
ncbi:MAG: CotH kinase family protein, partial [Clostridia bacterium]|nr:CotH kinase family protein [Clostridia bacterium]